MSWFCRMVVLSLVAMGLAACGVRGDLEPPQGAKPEKDEPFVLDKII
jgi:predicted small lipoprotein YifL